MAHNVTPIAGMALGRKLVEIFGLEGKGVQRMVIDIDINSVSTLYVKCLLTKNEAGMLVKELEKNKAGFTEKDLTFDDVDDKGFRFWPEASRDRQVRNGEDPAEHGVPGTADVRP